MEDAKGNNLILLVDDEADLLESCTRILEDENFKCISTTDSGEVLNLVQDHGPSVVVTDFRMPGKDGMEILRDIQAKFPDIPVVMISAYATINGVVEAVKLGAFDYLTKPFSSDQFVITVRRAAEQYRLQKENSDLKKKLQTDFFNHYFVGKHPRFLNVVETIRKVAPTESNVLIRGETGTGKELAARAIHLHSKRAEGPFVVADCSTLTKETLEEAMQDGLGKDGSKNIFHNAKGGTLYLKQVEELNVTMQTLLYRVLQDWKTPSGKEWEFRNSDLRVIASCSVDLHTEMIQKKFRENLYYLINVVNIQLPSLSERKEDIGILCDHFFKAVSNAPPYPVLHHDALSRLMEYGWPGNVRELRNVVGMAASMAKGGVITVKNLPDDIRSSKNLQGLSFKEAKKMWMDQFEKNYLETLLLLNKGNISRASEEAGIARMSLYRMLKRTGLKDIVLHERSVEKSQPDREQKRTEN